MGWIIGIGSLTVFLVGGLTEDYLTLTTMRGFFFVVFGLALGWASYDSKQSAADIANKSASEPVARPGESSP